MKQKINEKKILYVLAFCVMMITLAYFGGKIIGKYIKNHEKKDISVETVRDINIIISD